MEASWDFTWILNPHFLWNLQYIVTQRELTCSQKQLFLQLVAPSKFLYRLDVLRSRQHFPVSPIDGLEHVSGSPPNLFLYIWCLKTPVNHFSVGVVNTYESSIEHLFLTHSRTLKTLILGWLKEWVFPCIVWALLKFSLKSQFILANQLMTTTLRT